MKSVTNAFVRADVDTADVVRAICAGRTAYCDDGSGDVDVGGSDVASLGEFCSGKAIGHVLRIDNRRQDNATFFTGLKSLVEVSPGVFKLETKKKNHNDRSNQIEYMNACEHFEYRSFIHFFLSFSSEVF